MNQTSEQNLKQTPQVTEIPHSVPLVDAMPQTLASQIYVDSPMAIENIYRQMIPYNTTDPSKISQQESILELLISNNICNDETFKIFIAEPDLHKDKASAILDDLYCVSKWLPDDENDVISVCEWPTSSGGIPIAYDAPTEMENVSIIPMGNDAETAVDVPMTPADQITTMISTPLLGEFQFNSTELKLTQIWNISHQIVHRHKRWRRLPMIRRYSQYSGRVSKNRNRFGICTLTLRTQQRMLCLLQINGNQSATNNIKLMRVKKNLV